MAKVTACAAPESSLLAEFGGPEDYTDCFYRDVPGEVSLPEFIERFYCSTAFLPEQLILKVLRTPASSADVRALASGEADRFGAWKVVGRRGGARFCWNPRTRTPRAGFAWSRVIAEHASILARGSAVSTSPAGAQC